MGWGGGKSQHFSSGHFERPNEASGLTQPINPDGPETGGRFSLEEVCMLCYIYIHTC